MAKLRTNPLIKSTKRTLPLIYDTEDATFEDLLGRDKLQTVHEDNLLKLLAKI